MGIMSQISSLVKLTALGRLVLRLMKHASERSTPRSKGVSWRLEHLRRSANMEIQEGGRTGGTRRDSALVSDIVGHAARDNRVSKMLGTEPEWNGE